MKHRFLILACLFLFLFSKLDAKRPNIVFFFTDDQTSSSLGCYGHPLAKTPNIDRLAENGTRFANSFVSQSICWVSRTTILTGLTGRSFGTPGQHDLATPESIKHLYPGILRKAGYRTGFAGKWHAKMPKGFKASDYFEVYNRIGRNPYKKQVDGSLRHETDLIVDRGIEFLESQPGQARLEHVVQRLPCRGQRPPAGCRPPLACRRMYEEDEIAPPA